MRLQQTDATALAAAILGNVVGADWPVSAKYMVSYRLKAGSCGYTAETNRYFDDEDALAEWLDDKAVWCSRDGNSMEFSIYEWDLGPQYKCTSFY